MQLKTSLSLLAAVAPFGLALPYERRGENSTDAGEGFGAPSTAGTGTVDTYHGNVGNPWGSNIKEISGDEADQYKYVAEISGQHSEPWTVVFWNKFGPDGKQDGHYGQSALTFTLSPDETKYVAFDENTQAALGATSGGELPTSDMGAYSCTWGELDFGNAENNEWSGFDVSAIQAQMAGDEVQGMQICADGGTCSSITPDAAQVDNAYTQGEVDVGGIGANLPSGPVKVTIVVGYEG
ncbi:hypothetical protein FQN54_006707 [Arachnomyces sp. PD_36]|nr:hypothetical protein FQN54_006707 [Arachnomyces sp. PD_36]